MRWTAEEEAKVVELATEGLQLDDIALAMNRPVGSVWAKLRLMGMRLPDPPQTTGQRVVSQKTALDALAKAWP
jgi:hypothetical protein